MLDAYKRESENEVIICGQLNELSIKEFTTKDGQPFISGTAEVICDQEINGKPVQTLATVKMSANRYKKDGNLNSIFDTIKEYPNQFTSVAAADDPSQASWVSFPSAKISENLWIDKNDAERSDFQINGNFMNKKPNGAKEGATFSIVGYLFKMDEENDKNGEPTGRIKLTVGVVGWNGRMNKIEMYAEGAVKEHIEVNWQLKDTVLLTGRINMVHKTETYTEKVGFGEPVEKTRSIFKKELIVTGGSETGFEEEDSYDEDSIRRSCTDRLNRIEELRNKAKEKAKKPAKAVSNDYGF